MSNIPFMHILPTTEIISAFIVAVDEYVKLSYLENYLRDK